MRNNLTGPLLGAAAAVVVLAGATRVGMGAVVTQWNFDTIGVQAAPFNSPSPTTGTGTAITLGMDNTYNGGNTASDDVTSTVGASATENGWRIRGTAHNGWATAAAGAAQYTQGIELDASTAGFQNIQFSFDWFSTNQAIRDLQFQYNTDVTNAAGWTNFGGTSPTGTYIAVPNDWYNSNKGSMISIDLSGITGANNDANFGVRLVSAFDSTGHVVGDYAGATLTSGQTTIYNNSSGNWRFDNLTVSGTAVPEPGSALLGGLAAAMLSLLGGRRARRRGA